MSERFEYREGPENVASTIEDVRRTVPRKIGAVMGNIVDFGAEVGTETGKLAGFTGGRLIHGIKSIRNAVQHGLKGDGYPETK